MGQRLNVEVCYDGEVLANAYYHWSAYTSTSVAILEDVIEAYNNRTEINPLRVAIEILQHTGAGVNENERTRITDDKDGKYAGIEFQDAVNRNEGVLAVTEEGIKETRRWEEGRVTVDIGTEEFTFDVMWHMSDEEYEDARELGDAWKLSTVENTGFDFTAPCKFCDFDKVVKVIMDNPDGLRLSDGSILCWIE